MKVKVRPPLSQDKRLEKKAGGRGKINHIKGKTIKDLGSTKRGRCKAPPAEPIFLHRARRKRGEETAKL